MYVLKSLKRLLLLILCVLTAKGYAQELKFQDSLNLPKRLKYDVKQVWNGLKYAYSRPAHWQGDDFAKLGAFAIGTAALYAVDEETTKWFSDQEPDVPKFFKEFGWYYGSPQNNFFISAGIYGYGLIANDAAFRKAGVLIISSNIAAGFIQSVSKTVFGRARPGENLGKGTFEWFSNEGGYHSFPSGHAVLSMTISHSIAKQFDDIWIKSGIYAVGMIAPISRLWEGAHWLTDVTAGIVLSIVTVDAIDKMLFKTNAYGDASSEKKISWTLKLDPNGIGIVGSF